MLAGVSSRSVDPRLNAAREHSPQRREPGTAGRSQAVAPSSWAASQEHRPNRPPRRKTPSRNPSRRPRTTAEQRLHRTPSGLPRKRHLPLPARPQSWPVTAVAQVSSSQMNGIPPSGRWCSRAVRIPSVIRRWWPGRGPGRAGPTGGSGGSPPIRFPGAGWSTTVPGRLRRSGGIAGGRGRGRS